MMLTAAVFDAIALRQLRREAMAELEQRHQSVADQLDYVLWELFINAHMHSDCSRDARIEVEVTSTSVAVRLPGREFDSVAGATAGGAHGLDTCAWRIERSGWSWRYARVSGWNEVTLERKME